MTREEERMVAEAEDVHGITDLALLGLDALRENSEIFTWIRQTASEEMKRECRGEDDDEWWDAVSRAYNTLLDEMKKINGLDVIRDAIH